MKILNWIQKNKYPITVVGFFIAVGLCLLFLFQGLKKDHSLDLVRQQLQIKEESRKQIIELRNQYQAMSDKYSREIITMQIRDSFLNVKAINNNNIIQSISKPEYEREKIKVVDNFNDTELSDYFNSLPKVQEPNDY